MTKKLNFKEYGSGRSLVLLHAFPLSSSMWNAQIEFLASQNWRVITPDFPGFGDSLLEEDVSKMEDLAQSVEDLLSTLNIEKAVIGGLSMGGYVALNFARMFPSKVEALILADTSAAADTEEKRASRFKLIEKIKENGAEILIDEMLPNLISDLTKKNKPELVENLKDIFKRVNAKGAIAALLGMAERRDHIEFIRTIDQPTLLIFGENDKLTTLEAARVLNENIQNSKLVVIPEVGHYSNLENPQLFNDAIIDFLNCI